MKTIKSTNITRDTQYLFSVHIDQNAKTEIQKIQSNLAETKESEMKRKLVYAALGAFISNPNQFNEFVKTGFDLLNNNSMHGANYATAN